MTDALYAVALALAISIILWFVSGGPMLWLAIHVAMGGLR